MKILYVANVYRHFTSFHMPYLEWLKEKGFEVHVAANGDESISGWDESVPYVDKHFDISIQRSPYSTQNIKAYRQLKGIVDLEKYDVVHCHTPMGGVLGRLAARDIRRSGAKVIYTAHGFHFCKGAPLRNWLLYYPVERFMARYTDVLITINREDFITGQKFKIKEHYAIPGIGLDIEKFKSVKVDREKKRAELNVSKDDIAIISVGDLTRRKNHEAVIKAISKVESSKLKYIICGKGELEGYLRDLISDLNIEDRVVFAGYRKDVNEILKSSDIFVFPSLWEGLGLAGIEAMAARIPVIASNRHGILEYAIDEETALLCEPKDSDGIARSIERLIYEEGLAEKLTDNAYNIIDRFDISNAMREMKAIYEKTLSFQSVIK
jgi:glycosyltransferase EpsD